MAVVATVDLADVVTSLSARDAAGAAALAAFQDTGFVILTGHGVAPELIARAYRVAQALFELPLADKLACAGGLRGYTPFGREHAKDSAVADLKEFWQVGRTPPEPVPGAAADMGRTDPLFPPNVWPSGVPQARETFAALFEALDGAGRRLLTALAPQLELPAPFLADLTLGAPSLLRVLHYPPVPDGAAPGAVRAAAHEDINFITLMVGARGAGLEILLRDGRWVPVVAKPGTLIVNAGDMLARLTGGLIPATTHRVVNPDGPNVSRHSMPFFLHPRNETDLTCLPSCLARGGVAQPPISAGDFLAERLRAIGLA
jgi:isopenicillin N synthase-like dioxygenase